MSTKLTGLWIVTVMASLAIGWMAAMQISRGTAFRDEEDAYERFSNAFTRTDSLDRVELVARLVRRLTPETLPGAIRALKDDIHDVYNHDLRSVMYYWAETDPRGMLEEMQTWSEVRAQRIAAGEAVYWVLKREGYDAARALFEQLPHHQRDAALPHLVLAAIEASDSPNLIELIDSYPVTEERNFVTGIVVGQILAAKGPEALAAWVESLPDGPGSSSDIKIVAFENSQTELMRRDQFEFLESWIDRIENEPWARSGGRRTIGIHLARRDPMRAIAYANGLSPEEGRTVVLDAVLRAFAAHDRDGALAWMRSMQPARDLDKGTASLVYEFALRDTPAALEMLERIRDPELFAEAKKVMVDHAQALSDDRRRRLLARVEEIPVPTETSVEAASEVGDGVVRSAEGSAAP